MTSTLLDQFEAFPRIPIALTPTPMHPLLSLQAELGSNCPRLFIKRDDMTGLALGGNKSRKLEYLFADARAKGADTLLTCGAAQSNHALQTAAAARKFGFAVRCILDGPPPQPPLTGNMLLHEILGTHIRWTEPQPNEILRQLARLSTLEAEAEAVRRQGGHPYVFPTGGSTPVGALGYVRAYQEIQDQLTEQGICEPSALFFASGSGGTQAGLVVGSQLMGRKTRLIGVEIEPVPLDEDGVSPYHRAVLKLTQETTTLLEMPDIFTLSDIEICSDYTGVAYGVASEKGQEAITLLARTEGIFLDPVYTGKAFAALLGWIREGRFRPDETVLFLHTGGVAGLFSKH